MTDIKIVIINNNEYIFEASSLALSLPSIFSTFEKIGTKQALNAPSANTFRRKFAIRIAITSASDATEAPRKAERQTVLINPVNLDNNVKNPTVVNNLKIFIYFFVHENNTSIKLKFKLKIN